MRRKPATKRQPVLIATLRTDSTASRLGGTSLSLRRAWKPAKPRPSQAQGRATPTQRRGAAILELSLLLPILLSLVLLCVDYGRLAFCYMAVTNAARVGAGYASSNPYTVANWQANTIAAVQNEFTKTANTWFVAADLTVPNPVLTQDGNGYWHVSVTATYSFSTLINWPWLPGYNTAVPLTRTVVMRGTI